MNDDLHTLSGAYAVHALTGPESALFERHLAGCAACADEVRTLRETAARLAVPVAEPPPAALRARILAAASRSTIAQATLPGESSDDLALSAASSDDATVFYARDEVTQVFEVPTIEGGPSIDGVRGVAAMAGAGAEGAARGAGSVGVAGDGAGGEVVPLRPRSRWRERGALGLAAVSTAAAVVLGAMFVQGQRELDGARDAERALAETRTAQRQVLEVLAAPDAQTVRQPVTAGGTGTIVLSRAQGRMLFTSAGLPRLPGAQVYELWLMGPDGSRPAGLLAPGDNGLTTPVLATPRGDDERVGLTVEPAGGSDRPTTSPVMLAELPAT